MRENGHIGDITLIENVGEAGIAQNGVPIRGDKEGIHIILQLVEKLLLRVRERKTGLLQPHKLRDIRRRSRANRNGHISGPRPSCGQPEHPPPEAH